MKCACLHFKFLLNVLYATPHASPIRNSRFVEQTPCCEDALLHRREVLSLVLVGGHPGTEYISEKNNIS
uniref:Secreted protein n=1 Tax=Timema poppense TaxID=170557 RepID=A0A7R9GY21_TIMPO|nr:unnamed protein product [Timema poppensis]